MTNDTLKVFLGYENINKAMAHSPTSVYVRENA